MLKGSRCARPAAVLPRIPETRDQLPRPSRSRRAKGNEAGGRMRAVHSGRGARGVGDGGGPVQHMQDTTLRASRVDPRATLASLTMKQARCRTAFPPIRRSDRRREGREDGAQGGDGPHVARRERRQRRRVRRQRPGPRVGGRPAAGGRRRPRAARGRRRRWRAGAVAVLRVPLARWW